jgi:hypothetical protein
MPGRGEIPRDVDCTARAGNHPGAMVAGVVLNRKYRYSRRRALR